MASFSRKRWLSQQAQPQAQQQQHGTYKWGATTRLRQQRKQEQQKTVAFALPQNIHGFPSSAAQPSSLPFFCRVSSHCNCNHWRWKKRTFRPGEARRASLALPMALVPLSLEDLKRLGWASATEAQQQQQRLKVTEEQLQSIRGRTVADRIESTYRYATIAVGGLFVSYMLALGGLGSFLPTVMGGMSTFWYFWGPRWQAAQRNFDWTQGRQIVGHDDAGVVGERFLQAALYLGRVESVGVVRKPTDKSSISLPDALQLYHLEDDDYHDDRDKEQYLDLRQGRPGAWNVLRLGLVDQQGRRLRVHSKLLPKQHSFLTTSSSLLACAILLSPHEDFQELAAISDICYFRQDNFWFVGDYPFLPQLEFPEWLLDKQEMDRHFWNLVQQEERREEHEEDQELFSERTRQVNVEEWQQDDVSWQEPREQRWARRPPPPPPPRRRQDESFGQDQDFGTRPQQQEQQQRRSRQRYQEMEEEEEEEYYDDEYNDNDYYDEEEFFLEQDILRHAQTRDNDYIRKVFLSMLIVLAGLVLISDTSFI